MLKPLVFFFAFAITSSTAVSAGTLRPADDRSDTLVVKQLDGQIYYGAAPKTDADFQRLRQLGVRRIVDMRTFKAFASSRVRRRAAEHGIHFQRIPMGFFPAATGNVPAILTQLTGCGHGAVYFHCNLGLDRAGMIVAIYRVEQFGWDPQHAFCAWKVQQFNTKLKGLDRYYWQHVGRYSKPR
ncbi:fused DSP-PTPase phosphatase/NAD kinase-like protein [Rhodopirellula sp. JC639]|uniref:fused DSP-PTPase phosphatase/NAD kinase-like protein n=1 Tax=Stieleria mannarensis TaxID=2755585 RepID=UPI0015FEBF6C|nr:tyrosine-protein phosphatase [Rhodopirellula sp. JC639]